MKAFIEGTIKIIYPNTFKDAKTGDDVQFNTYYIQGEDAQFLQLNSRTDYTKFIDKSAVITLDITPSYDTPTKFRVKIIDVKPI